MSTRLEEVKRLINQMVDTQIRCADVPIDSLLSKRKWEDLYDTIPSMFFFLSLKEKREIQEHIQHVVNTIVTIHDDNKHTLKPSIPQAHFYIKPS